MKTETLKPGDLITFSNYGREISQKLESVGNSGGVLFLKRDEQNPARWIHRQSVELVNGKPFNGDKS